MRLDSDQCYAALAARDRRFDGQFFVGVRTTRIYCRPVCPARTPRADRCRFFASAPAAELAGFRPCLRCRPELAPGCAPIDASSRLAWSALAQLRAIAARDLSARAAIASVAAQLGCTERHLRRVVRDLAGVSPVQFLQTTRLLAAKQLLTDTRLPITTVAHAAGFASLRRFNALFRTRYRLTPSDLRRTSDPDRTGVNARSPRRSASERGNLARAARPPSNRSARADPTRSALVLTLGYRAPFAWTALLEFLAAHRIPGVESIDAHSYARTLEIDGHRGWMRVTHDAGHHRLLVEVADSLAPVISAVLQRVRSLLDTDARSDAIDAHLARDARLRPSVIATPGLRVPGTIDGFELGWRTILGQQVSVRAATTVSGRVAASLGSACATPVRGLHLVSPTPGAMAAASDATYRSIGLTATRLRSLRAFAALAMQQSFSIDTGVPPSQLESRLSPCFGIGRWTLDYLAMRGLRWPDAFPGTDLVLARSLGASRPTDVERLTSAWSPWRAYAAMHLWRLAATRARGGHPHATRDPGRSAAE
ncbi:MAG: AlkA N-terminal domain-containing protein [Phycisphaerales bacterium]